MRYSIGQLAKTAGVPSSTLRYYERIGLLEPEGRTEGNYRYYGNRELQRLRFIRAAHASGFTLDDVTSLLDLREEGAPPCGQVRELLEKRLTVLRERIQELHAVERVVLRNLDICRKTDREDPCQLIDQLDIEAAAEPAPTSAAAIPPARETGISA